MNGSFCYITGTFGFHLDIRERGLFRRYRRLWCVWAGFSSPRSASLHAGLANVTASAVNPLSTSPFKELLS